MARALIILAKEGYQDLEEEGTRRGLEEAGFTVVTASTSAGLCRGKLGGMRKASCAFSDINAGHYDRIAFIGGPGALSLADDPEAHRIVQDAVRLHIPLGAICIAPRILASAGVLRGKRGTVWNGDSEQGAYLEEQGAIFTQEDVTIDGLIVTANGPNAADAFGKALAACDSSR